VVVVVAVRLSVAVAVQAVICVLLLVNLLVVAVRRFLSFRLLLQLIML
jgi:hypothetical protein